MAKFTRREILILGGLAAGSTGVQGCQFLNKLVRTPTRRRRTAKGRDAFALWRKASEPWWEARQVKRHAERKAARKGKKRPAVALPQPVLTCQGRVFTSRGPFTVQASQLRLNQWGKIGFVVRNLGNAPAWSCYVEIFEGPSVAFGIPFSKLTRTDRKIVTVQPGQHKEVVLQWRPTRQRNGSILVRCYDPVLDPGNLNYEQYHRQSSSGSWRVRTGGG